MREPAAVADTVSETVSLLLTREERVGATDLDSLLDCDIEGDDDGGVDGERDLTGELDGVGVALAVIDGEGDPEAVMLPESLSVTLAVPASIDADTVPVAETWAVALKVESPVTDATALTDGVDERRALTDAQAEPVIVAVAEGEAEAPLEVDRVARLVDDARIENDGGAELLGAPLADGDAVPDTVRAREFVGERVDKPVALAEIGAVVDADGVRDDAVDLLLVAVAVPPVAEAGCDAPAV